MCFQTQLMMYQVLGSSKEGRVTISMTEGGQRIPLMPHFSEGRAGQLLDFISPSHFLGLSAFFKSLLFLLISSQF